MFWKTIWSANVPPSIRLHTWRAYHNSLPDGANLLRRCGISPRACGWKMDSILHMSRDCWAGKSLGSKLEINSFIYSLRDGNMADWLFVCSTSLRPPLFRSLLCACWTMWCSRNDLIHNGKFWSVEEMAVKVKNLLSQFDGGIATLAGWKSALSPTAPSRDFVYCDASWKWSESQKAGVAGWGVLPLTSSPTDAEGLSFWKGLLLGSALGLEFATFFSDSMEVFRLLVLNPGYANQPSWLLACRQLLRDHQGWKIEWIPRDRNSVADFICKIARMYAWSWDRMAIPLCVSTPLPTD